MSQTVDRKTENFLFPAVVTCQERVTSARSSWLNLLTSKQIQSCKPVTLHTVRSNSLYLVKYLTYSKMGRIRIVNEVDRYESEFNMPNDFQCWSLNFECPPYQLNSFNDETCRQTERQALTISPQCSHLCTRVSRKVTGLFKKRAHLM
jgi:hypothetical protein